MAARGYNIIAPQPFPTAEDLFYDNYFDLQTSIRRLGRYYYMEDGQIVQQVWSYHHEFNISEQDAPHKILKAYAQVYTKDGKPGFKIILEEIEFRDKKEYIHHVFMEDKNLNALPDDISENWVIINKETGRRTVESLKTEDDTEKGKDRIDKVWNFWFAYWMKVQVLEFKETWRKRPYPVEQPEREV